MTTSSPAPKALRLSSRFLLAAAVLAGCSHAGSPPAQSSAPTPATVPALNSHSPAGTDPTIAAIRTEGIDRSQVMQTLDYLCNAIGPRLTGSPNLKRANEWTRDQFTSWGLDNAHLEAWGPFGKGWTLKRFSMQVIDPQTIPLRGFPKGWSPGFQEPFAADVVFLDVKTEGDLAKFAGKLKGKIVMISAPRTIPSDLTPFGTRYTDKDLAQAATLPAGTNLAAAELTIAPNRGGFGAGRGAAGRGGAGRGATTAPATQPTTQPARGNRPPGGAAGAGQSGLINPNDESRLLTFASQQGAALVISSATNGDGGIMVVQSAALPSGLNPDTSALLTGERPSIYTVSPAPGIPAQVVLPIEDYNRLAHMIRLDQKLKMEVDLEVDFQTADHMVYNTVAEIPGSDLKDQIVMAGARMDCWPSGTGATDNGVGCAAVMEAARILKALHLKPRRTIRFALWTGEEQGGLGSAAYVAQHFGARHPTGGRGPAGAAFGAATGPLTKGPDYENLSVYFNLDNGTGKIRGIYAQSDTAAAPLFQQWFKPFNDLGAQTVTLGNNAQTDHISFDNIGLPGFQFIQDPMDYFARTHHTNSDVYDRVQAADLKQASTILAAFLWDAANTDDRFPRKTVAP